MSYVMVPVPAEHQREFQEFIMTMLLRDAMNQWSAEGLTEVFDRLDPEQVRFVNHLAERCFTSSAPSKPLLASELGITEERVVELHREVNQVCSAAAKPELILFDCFPEFADDGTSSVPNILAVPRNAAELILQRSE